MAEPTGLEPATSDVTGRRSNQLNYDSAFKTEISKSADPIYQIVPCRTILCLPEDSKILCPETLNGRHGGIRTPNLFLVREAVYH